MRLWVALLLLLQAILIMWTSYALCPNNTEVGHLGATVYFSATWRYDVFHVNPPLTRILGSLFVPSVRPNEEFRSYSCQPLDRLEWRFGSDFIANNDRHTVKWCFVLARWALIPLLTLSGYFGYRLSRDIYGPSSGLVFLSLWCFSPMVLGWGATICPDAVAAGLGIIAIYTFRRWLREPNWPRAAIAGVCLGLLALSKVTWLIAFGAWPLIWCLWTAPRMFRKGTPARAPYPPLRQLAVLLVIGLYTLNFGYLFDGTGRPLGRYVFVSQFLRGSDVPEEQTGNRFAATWIGELPVPLPAEFVQGIDTQKFDFERQHYSYLRGKWTDHGWWHYYLYVIALKMPLGTVCLILVAVFLTLWGRSCNAEWRDDMVVLLPALVVFIVVSSETGLSAHPRYIFPMLSLLLVWTSKVGALFRSERSGTARLVMFLLVWTTASSLWVYPHSLSFFNELAGGPTNGPKHLLGSNVDWGQDLFYLERWYERHGESRPMRVYYAGEYPLKNGTVRHLDTGPDDGNWLTPRMAVTEAQLEPGLYALSVNKIFSRSGEMRYLLEFEPAAMAGYSIYIYDFTHNDVNRGRRALGLPELSHELTVLYTNSAPEDVLPSCE